MSTNLASTVRTESCASVKKRDEKQIKVETSHNPISVGTSEASCQKEKNNVDPDRATSTLPWRHEPNKEDLNLSKSTPVKFLERKTGETDQGKWIHLQLLSEDVAQRLVQMTSINKAATHPCCVEQMLCDAQSSQT